MEKRGPLNEYVNLQARDFLCNSLKWVTDQTTWYAKNKQPQSLFFILYYGI
jgi:hypothetical protein